MVKVPFPERGAIWTAIERKRKTRARKKKKREMIKSLAQKEYEKEFWKGYKEKQLALARQKAKAEIKELFGEEGRRRR